MAPKTHASSPKASAQAPGFFKSIPSSIYSPSFYAGIAGRSFWKGFWYLAGFTALLLVAWSVFVVIIPYATHADKIDETVEGLLHFYPEELVITIQDGKAGTNVEEPYYIRFSDIISTEGWNEEFKQGFAEGLSQQEAESLEEVNLVVIDTKTPFSMEQFLDYKAIVWLTQDAVYIQSENNQPEIVPLFEVPDTVINKQMADAGADTIWQEVKSFIPFLGLIIFVFAFLGLMIFRMVYLLIYSLALFIAFNIMKLPYDYAAAYKMGFYAITLSSLVTLAMAAQPWFPQLQEFFLMPTLLSLLVAVVNLDRAKKAGLIKEKKA